MKKKNDLKILKFPNNVTQLERQTEAILFAAEEPLDLKSIQTRLNVKADVPKILRLLDFLEGLNHLKCRFHYLVSLVLLSSSIKRLIHILCS